MNNNVSYADRFRQACIVDKEDYWNNFHSLIRTLVSILKEKNLPIDRVQIPLSRQAGFLHPTIQTAVLTWTSIDDKIEMDRIPHDWAKIKEDGTHTTFEERLRDTPYHSIIFGNQFFVHFELTKSFPENINILDSLKKRGYTDYYALKLNLADRPQAISIATKFEGGFDEESLLSAYREIEPLLGLALFASYQRSVAGEVAKTYLGARTGQRVLRGDILRGSSSKIQSGILFCDLRGFTSLNLKLGAEKMVTIMNQVFETIGKSLEESPAEILKFIGDALLIVLPVSEFKEEGDVKTCMFELAKKSSDNVHELGKELGLPLAVGFGGNIGQVVYGNVGTSSRLDFTVMGPAVNLASRLESLCSRLGCFYIVSENAKIPMPELVNLGFQSLKGVDHDVEVFGIKDR